MEETEGNLARQAQEQQRPEGHIDYGAETDAYLRGKEVEGRPVSREAIGTWVGDIEIDAGIVLSNDVRGKIIDTLSDFGQHPESSLKSLKEDVSTIEGQATAEVVQRIIKEIVPSKEEQQMEEGEQMEAQTADEFLGDIYASLYRKVAAVNPAKEPDKAERLQEVADRIREIFTDLKSKADAELISEDGGYEEAQEELDYYVRILHFDPILLRSVEKYLKLAGVKPQ